MDEQIKIQEAQKILDGFCRTMDNREWRYDRDDEEMSVETSVRGDDLPIKLRVVSDPGLSLLKLYSRLDFDIPSEKIVEAAIAVCLINDRLACGNFDLDVNSGTIFYRMSLPFSESLVSEEVYKFMIDFSVYIVDEFNDKLLMLSKGMLDAQGILDFMNAGNEEEE